MTPSRIHVAIVLLGLLPAACSKASPNLAATTAPSVAQPTTKPAPATMPTYMAPKGGFVTKYPGEWEPRPCNNAMLELVPCGCNNEARIVTVDVPFVPPHWPIKISIAQIDKGFVDDLKKRMSDVVIDGDVMQTMPGANARRIRATAVEDGVPTVVDAVVAVHHENVYILSAETDNAGASDATAALDVVIKNWQWK